MKKLIAALMAFGVATIAIAQTAIVLALATLVLSGGFYVYVLEKSRQISGMQWVVLEMRRGHTWCGVMTNRVPVSQEPSFPAFFIITDTNRNAPALCRVRLAEEGEIPPPGLFAPIEESEFKTIIYDDRGK